MCKTIRALQAGICSSDTETVSHSVSGSLIEIFTTNVFLKAVIEHWVIGIVPTLKLHLNLFFFFSSSIFAISKHQKKKKTALNYLWFSILNVALLLQLLMCYCLTSARNVRKNQLCCHRRRHQPQIVCSVILSRIFHRQFYLFYKVLQEKWFITIKQQNIVFLSSFFFSFFSIALRIMPLIFDIMKIALK